MPHQPSPTTKPRPVTYEMDARERAKARAGTLGYSAAPARVVGSPQGSRTISKVARVLSARGRRQIKTENFALPGRRYPIHDEAHARNALARVAQYGTADEKALVRRAVSNRYPGIGQGVEKMAMSRERAQRILEKVAQSQDSMVRRGQGYGAFGSAGRALREATGKAMLHPGDVIRRTAEGVQLVRKGKVLGEVLHDPNNKGVAYVGRGGLSGPNFRKYDELPRNQRNLVPRPEMAQKPPVPKASSDDVLGESVKITPLSPAQRAAVDARSAPVSERIKEFTSLGNTPVEVNPQVNVPKATAAE